jgi:hypothetical protein
LCGGEDDDLSLRQLNAIVKSQGGGNLPRTSASADTPSITRCRNCEENRATPLREPGLSAHVRVRNGEILEAAGTARENAQILLTNLKILVEAAGVEPSK